LRPTTKGKSTKKRKPLHPSGEWDEEEEEEEQDEEDEDVGSSDKDALAHPRPPGREKPSTPQPLSLSTLNAESYDLRSGTKPVSPNYPL
jgi:hypothetical protein